MKSITVTELRGVKQATIEEIALKIAIQHPAKDNATSAFPEGGKSGSSGGFSWTRRRCKVGGGE